MSNTLYFDVFIYSEKMWKKKEDKRKGKEKFGNHFKQIEFSNIKLNLTVNFNQKLILIFDWTVSLSLSYVYLVHIGNNL